MAALTSYGMEGGEGEKVAKVKKFLLPSFR